MTLKLKYSTWMWRKILVDMSIWYVDVDMWMCILYVDVPQNARGYEYFVYSWMWRKIL